MDYVLKEVDVIYKPSDKVLWLHGHAENNKLFGVKLEDVDMEYANKVLNAFNELGLLDCYWLD